MNESSGFTRGEKIFTTAFIDGIKVAFRSSEPTLSSRWWASRFCAIAAIRRDDGVEHF